MILAAVILLMLAAPQKSGFGQNTPADIAGVQMGKTAHTGAHNSMQQAGYTSSESSTSASLIPREVVQTEDFGQFSPEKILSGQNYLDPRSQVGYPETLGGVLRNANLQFRSEPMNPRTPVSIFNLSTIPPDTMRPKFEISPEYQ